MFKLVSAFLLLVSSSRALTSPTSRWFDWKHAYDRTYSSAQTERAAYEAFIENDEIIEFSNFHDRPYRLGHNEFSDMNRSEFSRFLGRKHAVPKPGQSPPRQPRPSSPLWTGDGRSPLPDRVDWVSRGAVTPVKNQAQCGSCWAFSAIASLEGALKLESGKLVSLSEQQLVSCDTTDDGCDGGLMDQAFDWLRDNGGACSERSYRYTSGGGDSGTCETTCRPVVEVGGHVDVAPGNETALRAAVASRPVSVAIEADQSVFQLYKSGVLADASCGDAVDHGVVVVGYGHDAATGLDYWRIKNSWGTSWGEKGFGRLVRGRNMCAIATEPSYPVDVRLKRT